MYLKAEKKSIEDQISQIKQVEIGKNFSPMAVEITGMLALISIAAMTIMYLIGVEGIATY
jgi:hypothetical protein